MLIVRTAWRTLPSLLKKVLVMNQSKVFMYDDTEKVFAHAAEIEQMGPAVPQVTRIFMRLSEMATRSTRTPG